MALDQSFVGRTYPPTEPYEVGREKIREFAEAVGDANPAYTDPEAAKALGHADVIAPPDLCVRDHLQGGGTGRRRTRSWAWTTAGWCTATRSSPTSARCARATGSRSPRPSRPIKSMAGNDIIDIRGEVHDESGEHVVTAWTKLVARAAEEG